MENLERKNQGIFIPMEIWLDEKLTALDKIILMEINSLDNENGCFASNEYLAKFCQCSITKVSTSISKLKKLNYIKVIAFDGRRRILKTRLSKSERLIYEKCKAIKSKIEKNLLYKTNKFDYEQREYNKEELESVYTDINKITEEDL